MVDISVKKAVDIIEKVAPGIIVGFKEFLECCTCDMVNRYINSASEIGEYIDQIEEDLTTLNDCLDVWKDVVEHMELDFATDIKNSIDHIIDTRY
jgi:hypothetical protein